MNLYGFSDEVSKIAKSLGVTERQFLHMAITIMVMIKDKTDKGEMFGFLDQSEEVFTFVDLDEIISVSVEVTKRVYDAHSS